MKKKYNNVKRGLGSRLVSHRHPMIYVDVTDGSYRVSINGDKNPIGSLKVTRTYVKPQSISVQPHAQIKRFRGSVSIADARKLSTIIAGKTGMIIPAKIIIKRVDGIYPPLGIVVKDQIIKIIK